MIIFVVIPTPEFKKLLDETLQNIENYHNVIPFEKLHVGYDDVYR